MSRLDIERTILGSILLDNLRYEEASILRPQDFSSEPHRRIFSRLVGMADSNRQIDLITLIEELDRHAELESVGGRDLVCALTDGIVRRPSIGQHVAMLREAADRRLATRLVEKAQRLAEDPSVPTAALVEIGGTLSEIATGMESPPPRFSEEAIALRFSRQYADDLRYVSRWGHWMRWEETRWVEDDTLHVFDLARGICRAVSAECGDSERTSAMKLASKATSAAVERLAAADRRHAATVSQWDRNSWLLNTPAGTVDLHSGEIRQHKREDHITKATAVGPGGDCPRWLEFLDRITNGEPELKSFLQRMVGYVLSGTTQEHALFFFYGTGANGKSVFLTTISRLLGDYAKTAPASSFTANQTEQHPTDLAGLRGSRFVTAIETEDGSRWAESKIKALTGGDPIAARFMRCDFFEFVPEFKLVIAGNHLPGLRSVDEAIRRRLHLVPFTVTIPENERDPHLIEKLRAEFPGILTWAIRGCLEWQRVGLNPPKIVRNATAHYLAGEDAIGRWLDDDCVQDAAHWTAGATLHSDYRAWSGRNGERPISQKALSQALESRGFLPLRNRSARGFSGISLRGDVTHVTDSPVIPVTHTRGRPI